MATVYVWAMDVRFFFEKKETNQRKNVRLGPALLKLVLAQCLCFRAFQYAAF
jgi:hypothetical protein